MTRSATLLAGLCLGALLAVVTAVAPAAAQDIPPAEDPYEDPEGQPGEDAEDTLDDDQDEPVEPEDADEPAGSPVIDEREVPAEDGDDDDEAAEQPPPGGTTTFLAPTPEPEGPDDHELIIPPLYLSRAGDVRTTAVFPFFYQRSEPEDYQLVAGLYYQRRAVDVNADVVFPFFWSFRTVDSLTLSIPPFYWNDDADGYDFGLAPLVFNGRSDDSVYTVIPPLLTAAWADEDEAYTFAGPFWRVRDGYDVDWGLFPLLWVSESELSSSIIAPPLFFRFVDQVDRSALTVVPPFYHRITPDSTDWGLAPLLHHSHDEEGFSWTVPPLLFHYSEDGDDSRLVTPLFAYFDVEQETTLITPLYQNHRGDTELDAVFPIFWTWRDPRQHSMGLLIPPLLYHSESPAENTNVVFPFFGRWHEEGLYTTWATPLAAHYDSHEDDSAGTWIFPNIQFSHTPTSNTFNFHPLVYSTSAATHRHLVLAPIYWDFEDYEDDDRITIGFPLLWRVREGSDVWQLAGNTWYRHYREGGVPGWEFHFFPLFSYGEPRPGDHWWNILFGLVGYEREGDYAHVKAFYIPFEVDGPASTDTAALSRP